MVGTVDGHQVLAGRALLFSDEDIEVPESLNEARLAAEAAGHTAVIGGWDGLARAVLVVADAVKPTSAPAVTRFGELGLTPVLLTGDNESTARSVADEVGIETGDRRGASRGEGAGCA